MFKPNRKKVSILTADMSSMLNVLKNVYQSMQHARHAKHQLSLIKNEE